MNLNLAQWAKQLLMAALIFSVAAAWAQAEVLVPNDSTWKWLHPAAGKDPAEADEDFHTTFYLAEFDDSTWQTGKDEAGPHGGFGYGDEGFKGVDLKQPEDTAHRKSAYFRLKFHTDQAFEKLVLKCQRDDGLIVYLDGKEVARDNVPADEKDQHALFASETVAGAAETTVMTIPLKGSLSAGDHVLAISLHNRAGGSSDLRLAEVSLESTDESRPTDE